MYSYTRVKDYIISKKTNTVFLRYNDIRQARTMASEEIKKRLVTPGMTYKDSRCGCLIEITEVKEDVYISEIIQSCRKHSKYKETGRGFLRAHNFDGVQHAIDKGTMVLEPMKTLENIYKRKWKKNGK